MSKRRVRPRRISDAPRRSRRLRKKLRVGEFREFGFELAFELPESMEGRAMAIWLDAFEQAAWDLDLRVGRLIYPGTRQNVVVRHSNPGSVTEDQRVTLRAWVKAQPGAIGVAAGPLVDLNSIDYDRVFPGPADS